MAQAVHIQDGECIDYTPGADIAAGEVVVQNNIVGVATSKILNGILGSVQVEGIFDFTKATGAADLGAIGTTWYWDDTNNVATKTATGNTRIGQSVQSAAGSNGVLTADTLVRIKLSGVGNAGASQETVILPAPLKGLVNSAVWKQKVAYAFDVISVGFRTGTAATTAAKAASAQAQISGVAVTGGLIALTSANQAATGTLTAGTAPTALLSGVAGDTIEFAISSVTAFVEGDGWFEVILQRK